MAVFDITRTIGTTARDYSTIAAAESGIPSDLTAVEEWNISNISGTFTLDEGLSFSPSGATGQYIEDDGSTMLFELLTGTVTSSDSVSGDSSSATANIDINVHKDGATWTGECYNDSEFTVTSTVTFSGTTTDATRTITLTAAANESFQDDVNKTTNALKYDVANGVGIRKTNNYVSPLQVDDANVTIKRLQLGHTASNPYYLFRSTASGSTNVIIKDCILDGRFDKIGVALNWPDTKIVNCIVIQRMTNMNAPGIRLNHASTHQTHALNCTIVMPDDLSGGGSSIGLWARYGTTAVAKNCAVFGPWDTTFSGTFDASSGYNATDAASAPGSNNQTSKTYSSQFENINDATSDFRVKSGSDLVNGTRDAANTNDLDIIAQTRDTTTPTIGCWEYITTSFPMIIFRR